MPRTVQSRLLPLLGVLLLVVPLGSVGADPEVDPALAATLRKTLHSRATKWWQARKRLTGKCAPCRGDGRVRRGREGWVPCESCEGRRRFVNGEVYRTLFHEMRSPAYRAQEKVERTLARALREAGKGRPWPDEIKIFRLGTIRLVDATRAVVEVTLNRKPAPEEQKWLWAKEPGRPATWYVYDETADGPWPAVDEGDEAPVEGAPEEEEPTEESTGPRPLTRDERIAVAKCLLALPGLFEPFEYAARRSTLVVKLRPRFELGASAVADRVRPDAVVAVRALFSRLDVYDGVEFVWCWPWRDEAGNVEVKPAWTSSMGRAEFHRVNWARIPAKRRAEQLRWRRHLHEGWTPWDKQEEADRPGS